MKVPYKYFPQDIKDGYNLHQLKHTDGYMYVQINKGMYGLKQAALLAYKLLSTLLCNARYFPLLNTSGMWKYTSLKTVFCLCVDNFGVKYYNKEDLLHLKYAIGKNYTCKVD